MILVTFSFFYVEGFSLHNMAVNRPWQLVGTELTKASLGGNLVFEDPGGGRKLRGEFKFSPTGREELIPLDTMIYVAGDHSNKPSPLWHFLIGISYQEIYIVLTQ